MRLWIANFGLRIGNGRSRCVGAPPLQIRIPQSAIRSCLLVAACTPVTTRPNFMPDPQALEVIVLARPERVTAELPALVAAESLRVERTNVRDGYLETAWYDTRTGRSHSGMSDVPHGRATVKLRFWADPYVPGQTRLTVEVVYRPRYDPSRTERDMEVVVPEDHAGWVLARTLVEKLKQAFGTPKGEATPLPNSSPTAPSRPGPASHPGMARWADAS